MEHPNDTAARLIPSLFQAGPAICCQAFSFTRGHDQKADALLPVSWLEDLACVLGSSVLNALVLQSQGHECKSVEELIIVVAQIL